MITVNHLTKKYNKVTVLNDLSFTINKGSLVGIIGSNGAGKSTLISIMANIIKPTKGSVAVSEGKIGYVPQEITLFPNLTVKDNLHFWDTMSNNHKAKDRSDNIKQIVQVAQLKEHLHKKVSQLSGGLKRRLNIGVALLSHPDILIMDEPTVGMDISSRREMVDFIKQLSQAGTTILYVSHHPDEIEQLCDHIICLNKGDLVFNGSLTSLKERYPGQEINDIVLDISNSTKKTLGKGGKNEVNNLN